MKETRANFITIAYAATTAYLNSTIKMLKENGYTVVRDGDTCTASAPPDKEGEEEELIFRALKMGKMWMMRGDRRVFTIIRNDTDEDEDDFHEEE